MNINTQEYWDDRYEKFGGPEGVWSKLKGHHKMYKSVQDICADEFASRFEDRSMVCLDVGSGPGLIAWLFFTDLGRDPNGSHRGNVQSTGVFDALRRVVIGNNS